MAKLGLQIPKPKDHVFVEDWIYRYGLNLLLGEAAFGLGFFSEAKEALKKVRSVAALPDEIRIAIEKNLSLF